MGGQIALVPKCILHARHVKLALCQSAASARPALFRSSLLREAELVNTSRKMIFGRNRAAWPRFLLPSNDWRTQSPSPARQRIYALNSSVGGFSSSGREPALQVGGSGFDPRRLHQTQPKLEQPSQKCGGVSVKDTLKTPKERESRLFSGEIPLVQAQHRPTLLTTRQLARIRQAPEVFAGQRAGWPVGTRALAEPCAVRPSQPPLK